MYKKQEIYSYYDLDGNLLYEKIVRSEPEEDGISPVSVEINWVVEKGKRKPVFYNLPVLKRVNPEVIYVTQSEKAVQKVNEVLPENEDRIAVISYENFSAEYKNSNCEEYFYGKEVVIFADNETAKIKSAKEVASIIGEQAREVSLICFREKPEGYSIVDWLNEGNSLSDALLLKEILSEAEWVRTTLENVLNEQLPSIKYYSFLNIPESVITLFAGYGSHGKSTLLVYLLLNLVNEGLNVVYYSLEDSLINVKRKLQHLIPKYHESLDLSKGVDLRYVKRTFNFTDKMLQRIERDFKNGADFILIDPIGGLFEDENRNAEVQAVLGEMMWLVNKYEKNIVLTHHLNKNLSGQQPTDKEDLLNRVRGASSFVNNTRQVFFIRRDRLDLSSIHAICVKNNFGSISNDFLIENLLYSPEKKEEKVNVIPSDFDYLQERNYSKKKKSKTDEEKNGGDEEVVLF